ncbi:MAG: hypothetical protein AAFZ09_19375, partial [Pseudomonadota bacterium]
VASIYKIAQPDLAPVGRRAVLQIRIDPTAYLDHSIAPSVDIPDGIEAKTRRRAGIGQADRSALDIHRLQA